MPNAKMWLARCFVTGIALASWSCQKASAPVGVGDVRHALAGSRHVQPRLSGLKKFESCASSDDFIPVARCGKPLDPELLVRLGQIERRLKKQLATQATADQLHGAALVRLVADSSRSSLLETAVTYLREALGVEEDPLRQAELLTDLAGAHLLLAEQLQSPLEVATALEASLHALELNPSSPEARFNQQLALVLLGLDSVAPQSISDPWTDELRHRLLPERPETSPQDCPSESAFRRSFSAWASKPDAETEKFLPKARSCWTGAEDRLYADLLDRATSDPGPTARAWKTYDLAETAFRNQKIEEAERHLRALQALRPPPPIALMARRIAAALSYQRGDQDHSRALFETLAADAATTSYFRLEGESRRMLAVISQIRGEIGEAFRQCQLAYEAARKTGSPSLEAGVANLRAEILERIGREEEAWRAVVEILRSSSQEQGQIIEMMALRGAARLAQSRNLSRVAKALYDRGVEIGETLGPAVAVSSLRTRGEFLLDLGQADLARSDLTLARKILAESPLPPPVTATIESDLLFLEGKVAKEPGRRRAALEAVVASYRATDYDFRILSAQLALAELQRDQGDASAALATLDAALGDLAEEVAGTSQWSDAPALVTAARPLIEELVALKLEYGSAEEVRRTLGTVFGLRSGAAHLQEIETLPPGEQRLTTFALPREVMILFESGGELVLERRPVDRARLGELRERLLLQLRNQAPEARLSATSAPLSRLLLEPVLSRLSSEDSLTIVADDVLAGLPFHLLPAGANGELLLDRVAVRYATDLRRHPERPAPESMLAVGISSKSSDLPPLPFAGPEASEVAALYPEHKVLLDPDSDTLQRAFLKADAVHVSGHFIANTRSPLDSYLALGGEAPADRLSLRQLLSSPSHRPRLLYLSACDTGRGLPPSAHGLASLAQAFTSAGIEQTLLTLWPLEDRLGKSIAASFHRRLLAGEPAAEALRAAQFEHRGEHPGRWGPLVLMD